ASALYCCWCYVLLDHLSHLGVLRFVGKAGKSGALCAWIGKALFLLLDKQIADQQLGVLATAARDMRSRAPFTRRCAAWSQSGRGVQRNAHRSVPLVGDEVPVCPGHRKKEHRCAWPETAGGNGTMRGNGEAARLPGRGRHRWLLRRSILPR